MYQIEMVMLSFGEKRIGERFRGCTKKRKKLPFSLARGGALGKKGMFFHPGVLLADHSYPVHIRSQRIMATRSRVSSSNSSTSSLMVNL